MASQWLYFVQPSLRDGGGTTRKYRTLASAKKYGQSQANKTGKEYFVRRVGARHDDARAAKTYSVLVPKSSNPSSAITPLKSLIGKTIKVVKQGNRIVAQVLSGGMTKRGRIVRRVMNPRSSKWHSEGKKAWSAKTRGGDSRYYNVQDAWNAQKRKPKDAVAWIAAHREFTRGFTGK